MTGFEDPWEQRRLLSDPARNRALVALLERRAPGARVLEVGCGTGLWSVLAGKLGAVKVYAVEPTPLVALAQALVTDNGLDEVVEVLAGRIEALPVRPVDLAFSELLNADPFFEGVVPAMRAARAWVAPGGVLAPRRLRVRVALARVVGPVREARAASAEVGSLGRRFGLRVDAVRDWLATPGTTHGFSLSEGLVSTAAVAWDLDFTVDPTPAAEVSVEVEVTHAGPVAGAVVWFEATLDGDLVLQNPPGSDNHWGMLVCGWPEERGVREGQRVSLLVRLADGKVDVSW